MPIYEYQCDACQHAFDALQKMSDDILTECPECGELRLRKLISAPNFRLKGAGWYETDFKDKNQRNLAGGSDTAASDTAGGDTKAASKDGDTKAADKSAKKSTDGTAKAGSDKAAKAKPVSKSGGSSSSE